MKLRKWAQEDLRPTGLKAERRRQIAASQQTALAFAMWLSKRICDQVSIRSRKSRSSSTRTQRADIRSGSFNVKFVSQASSSYTTPRCTRPTGVVDAMTVDQLVDDDTCSGQPVSGTTTLHGRGDTAVITNDGATDCDPDQNARVSVNGKDRGLVAGINCSVANVGATASGVSGHVFAFAAFAALAAFVRRRRPLG